MLPQQTYTMSQHRRIVSKFITCDLYLSGGFFYSFFSEPFRDNKTNMITCFSYDLIKVKKKWVAFLLLIVKTSGFVGWLSNLFYVFVDSCIYILKSII